MKKLSPKELGDYAVRLKGLLAVLTGDMDRLEQEALGQNGHSPEMDAEDGTDSYSQEFTLELLQRDESTVREILAALERVKIGSFGACEGCGTAIVKERLKLMPHARNCIECQRKEEEGQL